MTAWQEFESIQDQLVPPTHPVYQRVVGVVKKIVDSNQDIEFMREQTWTILVIDSKEVNAYVLPACINLFHFANCVFRSVAVNTERHA